MDSNQSIFKVYSCVCKNTISKYRSLLIPISIYYKYTGTSFKKKDSCKVLESTFNLDSKYKSNRKSMIIDYIQYINF